MNRPLLSRIMPFLLGFYALSLVAFIAYVTITFSDSSYLPMLRWEYTLKRAFILFIDYLIPVHAAAIAVAASLAAVGTVRSGGSPQPFNRIVSSTLIAFLLLTAAYTALFEGVYPRVQRRLVDMEYQSRLARLYKGQANEAEVRKEYSTALDAMDRYLAIDPKNKPMIEKRLDILAKAGESAMPAAKPKTAALAAESERLDAQGLVDKAQAYFKQGDWFSAKYFATAAMAADSRRRDAVRIAALAENELAAAAASKNQPIAELFAQKKNA